jgi:lipoprotein-anchoring transpeptidase ErfK/SrfK
VKYFIIASILIFSAIGIAGWMKKEPRAKAEEPVQELALGTSSAPVPIPTLSKGKDEVPEVDRIHQLFALDCSDLPIVETVSFTSRVPWLKDRPAWIADYASHFQTSRHFIARSLNKKVDYFNQKVHLGDRFNVFKKDKDIKFHLVVDLSNCRMWFYYLDGNEKGLLKTYKIGVGKPSATASSGSLTPVGTYKLGDRIAIYKPGITGFFQDDKVEMIRVFGTRWLPIEGSEVAKGLGIHGLPWYEGSDGQLVEDRSKIGKFDSDGCIRMASEDIEEIFAIVITKPTSVEIVKEYKQ